MRLRLILPRAWASALSASALAMVAFSTAAGAQKPPQGLWWTEDRSGVIAIAPCPQGLCGRIVGQPNIRDPEGKIPVDIHGVPHCGLTILTGRPTGEPGHYRGTITDPEDGRDWRSEFWVADDGRLRLRGYVMLPLLGQTQTWPPFDGQTASDCSIR